MQSGGDLSEGHIAAVILRTVYQNFLHRACAYPIGGNQLQDGQTLSDNCRQITDDCGVCVGVCGIVKIRDPVEKLGDKGRNSSLRQAGEAWCLIEQHRMKRRTQLGVKGNEQILRFLLVIAVDGIGKCKAEFSFSNLDFRSVYQKFQFPAEYTEDILQILKITRKQFQLLEESVHMLFAKLGAFIQDHSILDSIRSLESDIDQIEENLYQKIYAADMDLAHQQQVAHILENICDISDIIENIADSIQIMLIIRKV